MIKTDKRLTPEMLEKYLMASQLLIEKYAHNTRKLRGTESDLSLIVRLLQEELRHVEEDKQRYIEIKMPQSLNSWQILAGRGMGIAMVLCTIMKAFEEDLKLPQELLDMWDEMQKSGLIDSYLRMNTNQVIIRDNCDELIKKELKDTVQH